jgi:glycosyltransferase domain-containing protein
MLKDAYMNQISKNLENYFYKKSKNSCTIAFDELNKVTIVVPSYERQEYLLRQFVYWHGSGVQLLILDGSSMPLPEDILEIISSWTDVSYHHLPIAIEARLNNAIDYIDTQYVTVLGDDEFYLKGALKNLVLRLDADTELSGCIGQSVGFGFNKETKSVCYRPGYAHWQYSAVHDGVNERLSYAMNPYNAATAYGLFRKDIWQKGWGEIVKYSCGYTAELHQAIATYITGKYTSIDELYWLRSYENAPVENAEWDRKLRFDEWWRGAKYGVEKELFLSNLANLAIQKLELDNANARKIVLDAVDVYLAFCDDDLKKSSPLRQVAVKILRSVLPKRILGKLKDAMGSIKASTQNSNAQYSWLAYTRSNNIEENQREMMCIETLVKEFYDAKS